MPLAMFPLFSQWSRLQSPVCQSCNLGLHGHGYAIDRIIYLMYIPFCVTSFPLFHTSVVQLKYKITFKCSNDDQVCPE